MRFFLLLVRPFRARWRAGLALGLMLWSLAGVAEGQPRPDVTSWVVPDTVRRGEPFTLIVTANTPAHRAVGFPEIPADSAVFGPLTVQRRSRMYTRRVGGLYAIDSVAYTVTPPAADSVRIPPLPIRIDAGVGTLTTHTRPRVVRVAAAPPHPLLRAFEGGPEPPRAWTWAALVVVLAAGVGGGLYLRARRAAASAGAADANAEETEGGPEPADALRAETERRLDELESVDLADPDATTAFYVELAALVRASLSRRLGLTDRERTATELRAVLDRRDDVPRSVAGPIQNVLEEAERVKYAGWRPPPETARKALRDARAGLGQLRAEPPTA